MSEISGQPRSGAGREDRASDAPPSRARGLRRSVDWLLTDIEWLVTCDEAMRCIPDAAVAIEKNTLVAIGPSEDIEASYRGKHQMDLGGHLVMPGLVNTHTHAAMSCFRGLADDLPLQQWLHEIIFPAEAKNVDPDLVYWGTLLSSIEMLKNGVTTFCDGYFFEASAAQAALDAGIRAVLGQGILDFPTPDQPDPSKAGQTAEAFLQAFPRGVERLRPSIFCHAPYTCGPDTIRWAKALCREHGILFQIHLSETSSEVEDIVREHGERPVHYLDRLGALDPRTLCAHAIWLDPGEIELLGRRGTRISHNPESNMKLASGIAPIQLLREAGSPVGLGTDGCASNNDLDMFGEMDRAAKMDKVFKNDPVACPAPEVLRMATREGAIAIGWEHAIGSLEPGKCADLISIDLNQPHLTPLYDPVSHLVYAARGSDVRHVWVDGRLVVSGGTMPSTDAAQAMREVRRIAERIKAGP